MCGESGACAAGRRGWGRMPQRSPRARPENPARPAGTRRADRAQNRGAAHRAPERGESMRIQKAGRSRSKGFTLIELLVVVAIIGILAAIAILHFSASRSRGFNARVAADCRNVANAHDAPFVDNHTYTTGTCITPPGS